MWGINFKKQYSFSYAIQRAPGLMMHGMKFRKKEKEKRKKKSHHNNLVKELQRLDKKVSEVFDSDIKMKK